MTIEIKEALLAKVKDAKVLFLNFGTMEEQNG